MPEVVRDQIRFRQKKEPACGMQTSAMLWVIRVEVLEAEMDETSGKLDQPFIENIIRSIPSILQPEMLKHVMGLEVTP